MSGMIFLDTVYIYYIYYYIINPATINTTTTVVNCVAW